MSEWDEFRKAVGEGLKGKVDTKLNNVVNIEDGTPYKGGFMPEPQDNWYELHKALQEDYDDLYKLNVQQARIMDNQGKENLFLDKKNKQLESENEQLKRDKKELQEQLQKKRRWGKWIKS